MDSSHLNLILSTTQDFSTVRWNSADTRYNNRLIKLQQNVQEIMGMTSVKWTSDWKLFIECVHCLPLYLSKLRRVHNLPGVMPVQLLSMLSVLHKQLLTGAFVQLQRPWNVAWFPALQYLCGPQSESHGLVSHTFQIKLLIVCKWVLCFKVQSSRDYEIWWQVGQTEDNWIGDIEENVKILFESWSRLTAGDFFFKLLHQAVKFTSCSVGTVQILFSNY